MKKIFIVGMTGPTGSGKTTVADRFSQSGIPVVISDEIARNATAPGSAALREIAAAFGEQVLNPDKTLNRARLAEIIFENEQKNKLLCDITHPLITIEIRKIIRELLRRGKKIVLIDAPLLFESNVWKMCDYTFSVLSDHNVRKSRIMLRDNLSQSFADQRLNAQREDAFYISRSNKTIYNDGTKEQLLKKTDEMIEIIRRMANEARR